MRTPHFTLYSDASESKTKEIGLDLERFRAVLLQMRESFKANAPVPTFVAPGPDNPMGSRAMYLYSGGKDTLFRIHGTNQPEYIGASISSGCIRMTNEDVIDLYNRVKMGTIVVVLEPKHGDSPFNSQMALQGGGNTMQ